MADTVMLFLELFLFLHTIMHFYCQQTGCTCDSPPTLCVWLCVVLLMSVGCGSRVPNENVWLSVRTAIQLPCCRNAYHFTHSSLSLSLFIPPSIDHCSTESPVFPLGFFCRFLPLQLCLLHVDLAQTHKSSTLSLLACSSEVCTCGLKNCQGSVRGQSQVLHTNGSAAAVDKTTARFIFFITLFNPSFFTCQYFIFSFHPPAICCTRRPPFQSHFHHPSCYYYFSSLCSVNPNLSACSSASPSN